MTKKLETRIAYLYSDDEMVSHIAFQTRQLRHMIASNGGPIYAEIYDSGSFGERTTPYMHPHVLAAHGIPAAVVISTDGGPGRGKLVPGFYVVLLYPDQGLLVRYTTYRKLADWIVRGCLADAMVEFELFPAGQGDSFARFLAPTQWAFLWPEIPDSIYWRPIGKATSMSTEQFFRNLPLSDG